MFKVVLSRHDLNEAQEVDCTSWVIVENFLELRGIDGLSGMVIFVNISVIREFMSLDVPREEKS